jgi:hypothetical protein
METSNGVKDPQSFDLPPNAFISSEPFPDTPLIGEDEIKEIASYEVDDLGGGVLVFKNVLKFDEDPVYQYLDNRAAKSHQNRWEYIEAEDGETYGINEDGFRYRPEDIPATPVRILHPIDSETPDNIRDFFYGMEDTIYKCLLKYTDYFPLIVGCLWWKNRGHILRYEGQGVLGAHCDNDTNYKVTEGVRYMPRGQMAARQTCGALVYLNDCVDTPEELNGRNFVGGYLRFFHLGIEYKPQKGDIVFFPTNYMASHDVDRMTDGVRYSYLSFFGQGSGHAEANIQIAEPQDSIQWCPAMWMNHIYDDYERYCKSEYSRISTGEETYVGINPVYQGRCVAQYGTTHDAESLDSNANCNTDPVMINGDEDSV